MNAEEIEQDTHRLATKLTFRFATTGNTHAPQITSPWRFHKSEMNRKIDEQEQKHYGEHK